MTTVDANFDFLKAQS